MQNGVVNQKLKSFSLPALSAVNFEEIKNYAQLVLTGRPLVRARAHKDGTVSVTEFYLGSRSQLVGLTYGDLPEAVRQGVISEDGAVAALRCMIRNDLV